MHLSFVAVFHILVSSIIVFLSLMLLLLRVLLIFFYIKMCFSVCVCSFYLFSVDSFFSRSAYVLCCSTLSMHLLMRPDRASKPKNTKANSLRLEYMFVATPSKYYGQMNWEVRQQPKEERERKKADKTKIIYITHRHSGCSCVPSSSPIRF